MGNGTSDEEERKVNKKKRIEAKREKELNNES